MNDEKEKIPLYMRIGKWWIIIVGVFISVGAVIWGIIETGEFPDEKYISAAAFLMLIATSLLQNIDLNLQREDLKLNRKALEEQREEMEKHTEEFTKTNKNNEESLEVQKFFELIRLKEDLYIDIIKEKNEIDMSAIFEFNHNAIFTIQESAEKLIVEEFREIFNLNVNSYNTDEIIKRIYNNVDDEGKEKIYELINKAVNETDVFSGYGEGVENSLIKLHNYNFLLEKMIDEGTLGVISSAFASMNTAKNAFNKMTEEYYGRPKKPTTIKQIYHGLLTKDEILLYDIINKNLDPEIIIKLEDAE